MTGRGMTKCHIALGGNIGDVAAAMDAALAMLHTGDETAVVALSRLYETAPVGVAAAGPFLNAAAAIETCWVPHEMLDRLKQIEQTLGRTPGDRWSARRIDLDMLLWGADVFEDALLTVPHPHMWYRRFVLDPLCDIAADVVHPVYRKPIAALRNDLISRPLCLAITGGCAEDRLAVGSLLRNAGLAIVPEAIVEGPLTIAFLDTDSSDDLGTRTIDLNALPGSFIEAAKSVLTAILDEPQVQSRPLFRMP